VHELSIQLTNAAMTDALTGIANRRHFLAALEREASLSRRHGYALSIAFFDVDKFKGGDKVLQRLAALATAQCRAGDLIARWGGDEFVILLPHTDESGARVIAERLLGAIRSAQFAAPGLRVTSSIGVASRRSDDASIDALLRRADSAMYQAKRMGSNRVETPPLGGADPAKAVT
jgi:diguanylate cyclase (GGDEF)-like protein